MIKPEIPASQIHLGALSTALYYCSLRQHLFRARQESAYSAFFLSYAQRSTLDHREDPGIHVHSSTTPDLSPDPLEGRDGGQGVIGKVPRMH
jgi:hypothetical protein